MIEHTVSSYNEQLELLKTKVITMGHLTREQLKEALDGLERTNPDSARRVIERERSTSSMSCRTDIGSTPTSGSRLAYRNLGPANWKRARKDLRLRRRSRRALYHPAQWRWQSNALIY